MELELAAMEPEEAAELAARAGARATPAAPTPSSPAPTACSTWSRSSPAPAPPRRGPGRSPAARPRSVAAGKIHSDLERGFIRAEVIPWDALVAAGSWSQARENATLRMEGKDYVVQEGDVLQIRFNV